MAAGLLLLLLTSCSKSKPVQQENVAAEPLAAPIDTATAGEISGRVSFTGARPQRIRIALNSVPECVEVNKEPLFREDLIINNDNAIRDVLVYVKQGLTGRFPPPAEVAVLDQSKCRFDPHVVALMAGQKLQIKNSDPWSHNVHPFTAVNREWNKVVAPGGPDLFEKFGQPEVGVQVRCNLHPWMRANIAVLPNPFFAITNDQGEFAIKGLPPGEYIIEAWQEKLGSQTQKVVIVPKQSRAVEFSFKA